jgi:transcriptional regulator of arginine metabolism
MNDHNKQQVTKTVSFALRQLLLEGKVGTQEAICKALEKQGFAINQSKVSRLLNKIGAIKVSTPQGATIYRLPHEHGLAHELQHSAVKVVVRQWVIDVVSNGMLIVIHTLPAAAAMVARELDLHHLTLSILGSIAGDDTIFVAPKDPKKIRQVLEGVKTVLGL